MPRNFDDLPITFLAGCADTLSNCCAVPARQPFDERILEFLNEVSKSLLSGGGRVYPDVVTFAFWIRKASTAQLREKYAFPKNGKYMGRGVLFHIAPSNVPVNFAYSLVAGLLMGNVNIVRVPSKSFPQTEFIAAAFAKTMERFADVAQYICLVRYERNREINDILSSLCDVRIVWGGDATIAELRKSPLTPRAGEICFADRFSLTVIDSDAYMAVRDKDRMAEAFYNDTYLSDQNACTSPRFMIWTGTRIEEAKEWFWSRLHSLVSKRYNLQPIQAVDKLTSAYSIAATREVKILRGDDNLITRVCVHALSRELVDRKDNSGYFFEYDCEDIRELRELCDDKRCQTVGYIGSAEMLEPLLALGIKGVDRVVPVGKTMDFDLIWDGYDLTRQLTRVISLN